jgi:hypothetical protein
MTACPRYAREQRASICQDCGDPVISPGGISKKRCVECEYAAKLARDRARAARKRAAATQGDAV